MSTILFPSPIFGPVHSRRLGVSLGINLMPADGKICTFDCIYCECGLNADHRPNLKRPTREEVATGLRAKLESMAAEGVTPNVITFAGNGEPTIHPDFPGIIDDTIALRDIYFPEARISVLSNATRLDRPEVFNTLLRVDNNIQKLDTVSPDYISLVDRPNAPSYDVERVIEQLAAFKGHVIIQTMFMHGTIDGQDASNLNEAYIKPWLDALVRIQPSNVMIYTIDRETPLPTLSKATHEELDAIRDRIRALGIPAEASY